METDKQLYEVFNSPVLSVLYPILEPSDEELTRRAASRYSELENSPRLDSAHRQKWLDVFQSWVMHRLKLETEEFLKMIVHLPDTEETVWGQQLKARWTNEGKIEGELAGEIQTLENLQRRLNELLATEKLPSGGHAILSAENEEKLAELRRKRRELQSK